MRYIALEEAFSIPELADRQPPPWPANRFSQRHLADWARKLPDFTEYRLPEMDAAGIDADRDKVAHGNVERILRL
jgi:2,3-dihydroxybenzoate decarboxylase